MYAAAPPRAGALTPKKIALLYNYA